MGAPVHLDVMALAIENVALPADELESLHPGRVIGGKYELVRPIGEGGMGVVWYATHLGLDAPVAIKLLNTAEHASTKAVDTFLHEAKTAAAVRHRNVAGATDFGRDADGQPFMVMELLEGTSLASRFEEDDRLPVAELVDVMAQCLSGLAAVHAAGILHRDLKPENVFLVSDGDAVYPKLIDFGISRSLRDTPASGGKRRGAMLTNDGVMMGTPHYMSPEQARGLADVDQRADLYAIGVMLYEGLTGRPPYDLPNVVELLGAIVRGGAPSVVELRPDVGVALSAVVAKAMAPREDRYADAREMRMALLAATSVASSTPVGPVMAPARTSVVTLDAPTSLPMRRPTAKVVTLALCAIVLALGLGVWAALDAGTANGASPAHAMPVARMSHLSGAAGHSASLRAPVVAHTHAPDAEVIPVATPPAAVALPRARHHAVAASAAHRTGTGIVNGVFRDPGF